MVSNANGQLYTRTATGGVSALGYVANNNISESPATGSVNMPTDLPTNSTFPSQKVPLLISGIVPSGVTVQRPGIKPASTALVAGGRQAAGACTVAGSALASSGSCVVLVRPVNQSSTSIVRLLCPIPIPIGDAFRPSRPRLVVDDKPPRIRASFAPTRYVVGSPSMLPAPMRCAFGRPPPVARQQLNARAPYGRPRLIVRSRTNKRDGSPNIRIPIVASDGRDSPLSCIEQLVANAGTDMSKTISDVESGVGDVQLQSSGGALLDLRAMHSELESRHKPSTGRTVVVSEPQGCNESGMVNNLLKNGATEDTFFADRLSMAKTGELVEGTKLPSCSEHEKRYDMENSSLGRVDWCLALNLKRKHSSD